MNPDRQRAFLRTALDGLAVLAAILIAFGLQTWWDWRRDRATTRELLGALQVEWTNEKAKLEAEIDGTDLTRSAMAAMLEAHRIGIQGLAPDSAAALYEGMKWVTYKPALAATNSLLLTDLGNVADPDLRAAIVAWPGVLDEPAPEGRALEELGVMLLRSDIARVTEELALPWTPDGDADEPRFGVQVGALALALIADEGFITRLRHASSVLYNYQADLRRVLEILEGNLGLLEDADYTRGAT